MCAYNNKIIIIIITPCKINFGYYFTINYNLSSILSVKKIYYLQQVNLYTV